MKRFLVIAFVLVTASWCSGQEAKPVPPDALDYTTADESDPLPRYLTPAERLLPINRPTRADFDSRTPPTGSIYCPAEYERQEGLLIAWEGYDSILTQMVVPITTLDPEAIVWVVVDNASEQSSATSYLAGAGADMSQVQFIIRVTDTVWIRDYGPRFIFEDGDRAIIDHVYNRPRPNDDAFNDYLSTLWSEPQYDIPLTHGGGNFHLFSNGDAFMSNLILTENPGLTEQDVIDLYHEYQNVNLTIYPGFPTSFDSTQHIDMWMFPVDDDEVIIGQYASSTGQPYTITENAVADLTARGYTVYRTPGWKSGAHYTYTNAVVINDLVFMSTFSGYTTQNNQALAVFQAAFEDKTVIPVDNSDIIGAAGAMHCIVMHVPVPIPLTVTLPEGTPAYLDPVEPTYITVQIDNGSQTYVPGSGLVHYRYDGGAFLTGALTSLGGNLYQATLPPPACDATPEFYFSAQGDGGATIYNPADAPASVYTAAVADVTVIFADDFETDLGWTVVNDPSLTDGAWQVGVPAGDGSAGDPTTDYDGSGRCYLTANRPTSSDVDGGPTYLISPTLDLTGYANPALSFAYWWSNDDQDGDPFAVAVSTDNGTSWTNMVTITNPPYPVEAWTVDTIYLKDYVTPTSTMKVRFSVSDSPNNSKDEGGVDAVEVLDLACGGCVAQEVDSCRDHGAAGRLCLDMGLSGGVESRLGGISELDVTLDDAGAFGDGVTVDCAPCSWSGTYGTAVNGNVVTVSFSPALPDTCCCTVTLDCGAEACVCGLQGDIDRGGLVTPGDGSIIKPKFGQTPTAGTAQFDYDVSGLVTPGDFSQVKPRFGNSLQNPCP